jgi:hypothetical protein
MPAPARRQDFQNVRAVSLRKLRFGSCFLSCCIETYRLAEALEDCCLSINCGYYLLSSGMTKRDAAQRLGISERSVYQILTRDALLNPLIHWKGLEMAPRSTTRSSQTTEIAEPSSDIVKHSGALG